MDRLYNERALIELAKSAIIIAVALATFFGLKGRVTKFAEWAKLPQLAFTPVRVTLRYSILIAAVILVLKQWGYPLDWLVAGLGTVFGLLAIGFVAVWSVLSNFLCTFVLIVFKPFSIGDQLEIPADNVRGKVVDLTLLFTTLHDTESGYVLIPNNTFFQKVFRRREGAKQVSLDEQLRRQGPTE